MLQLKNDFIWHSANKDSIYWGRDVSNHIGNFSANIIKVVHFPKIRGCNETLLKISD